MWLLAPGLEVTQTRVSLWRPGYPHVQHISSVVCKTAILMRRNSVLEDSEKFRKTRREQLPEISSSAFRNNAMSPSIIVYRFLVSCLDRDFRGDVGSVNLSSLSKHSVLTVLIWRQTCEVEAKGSGEKE